MCEVKTRCVWNILARLAEGAEWVSCFIFSSKEVCRRRRQLFIASHLLVLFDPFHIVSSSLVVRLCRVRESERLNDGMRRHWRRPAAHHWPIIKYYKIGETYALNDHSHQPRKAPCILDALCLTATHFSTPCSPSPIQNIALAYGQFLSETFSSVLFHFVLFFVAAPHLPLCGVRFKFCGSIEVNIFSYVRACIVNDSHGQLSHISVIIIIIIMNSRKTFHLSFFMLLILRQPTKMSPLCACARFPVPQPNAHPHTHALKSKNEKDEENVQRPATDRVPAPSQRD